MAGVLSDLKVLDLSWGIAGPLTAMLLGDAGADVIKVEKPGGDRFREVLPLAYKTWQRGKRSIELDLKDTKDLEVLKNLVRDADVLVESFAPGTTARLGIDYEALSAINPRLIYVSITGYGRAMSDSDRPGYDILVAARSGLLWEHRGWAETAMVHMMGTEDILEGLELDYSFLQGPPREGPILTASPASSLGAFYSALIGLHGALLARENTGHGQWVETSLIQGAITAAAGVWQRAENSTRAGFNSWIFGLKGPKGQFKTKDGRWVHNWVPNPRFLLGASEGDTINSSPGLSAQGDPNRFGMDVEETFVISHYQPILAERVAKFTADEWVKAAAAADMTLQDARPVEEALSDPVLLADGCVREVNDPELGVIRQVGVTINLEKTPWKLGGPAPAVGQDNATVRAEAAKAASAPTPSVPAKTAASGRPPLDGIRVLDLGLAIAGPFGTQQLADLGADVIKVNTLWDSYWHGTGVAFSANRGKRSFCADLKQPEALEALYKLVEQADVVQHNMRYEAAKRLKIDYESLKKVNPKLVYCHTRGHERGWREGLPGNDQTAACIAGVQYEDGGVANGGRPLWSLTSFGDTGNGYLSAIGIMQALAHRNKTGEGQFVDTAIVNAQLLNISYAAARPDGEGFDRPRLDAMATHLTALYGIYKTADEWIAIVATSDAEWQALASAVGIDAGRYPDATARWKADKALRTELEDIFAKGSAADWFAKLDQAGAPAEIVDPEGGRKMFKRQEYFDRKWLAGYDQALVGRFEHAGLGAELSDTPGVIQSPPLVVGEHTRELLAELGYSDARIEELREAGAVATWAPGEPQIVGLSSKQKKAIDDAKKAAEAADA